MAEEGPEDLFEHYRILRRPEDGSQWVLGRGNMGITYKAVDTRLQVTVALKIMNKQCADNERTFKYFLREARAAAVLNHRNIARVIHLSDNREKCFYAMEFIDGETIAEFVHRQQRLPASEALPIVQQVARALTAAHDKQLVHRDIKPANIMLVNEVDEAAVVKLIDFGLAKSFVKESNPLFYSFASGFTGTYEFASPEQISEEPLDCRSDIYSLGVTLWYMLAGTSPFQGTQFSVSSQHLEAPPPFHKLPADVPPKVTELLGRMLAKRPDDRPQTPVALRLEIKDCLETIEREAATTSGLASAGADPAVDTRAEPPLMTTEVYFGTELMDAEPSHEIAAEPLLGADLAAPTVNNRSEENGRLSAEEIREPATVPGEAVTVAGVDGKTAITRIDERASEVLAPEISTDEPSVEEKFAAAGPAGIDEPRIGGIFLQRSAPDEPAMLDTPPPLVAGKEDASPIEVPSAAAAVAPTPTDDHLPQPRFLDAPLPAVFDPPVAIRDTGELPVETFAPSVEEPVARLEPEQNPSFPPVAPADPTREGAPPPLAPEKIVAEPVHEQSDSTAWLIVGALAVVLAIAVTSVWLYVRPETPRPRRTPANPISRVTPAPVASPALTTNSVTPIPAPTARPTAAIPLVATVTPAMATRQQPYVNSLGMKFVPLGMGKLLICVDPTTRKDYAAFARANPSARRDWEKPEIDGVPVSQGNSDPVVMVSWGEANEFCEWLTRNESEAKPLGAIYRLPSVDEWRFARGSGDYPWGNQWPPPAGAGNYADATAAATFQGRAHRLTPIPGYDDGFATTSPVGSFPANALGLHDIGGNIRQWCLNLDSQGFWQYMGSSWHDADRSSLMARNPGGQPRNAPRTTQLGFRCVLEPISE